MKKVFKIVLILVVILAVGIFIFMNVSTEKVEKVENGTVIEPEEEISEEQMRQTSICLYFEDKQSMQLVKEEIKVDVKELVDTPYLYVINLLIQGPKKENLQNPIPGGTKVNKVELVGDCINLDLSNEFLNMSGTNAIYAIVNSLAEFKDVSSVKFFINGEENGNMKEAFVRK